MTGTIRRIKLEKGFCFIRPHLARWQTRGDCFHINDVEGLEFGKRGCAMQG